MGRDWDHFGSGPRRLVSAAAIALSFASPPARAGDIRETPWGALVLSWDASVWSVSGRDGFLQTSCRTGFCKGRLVVASVTPDGDCEPPTGERRPDVQEIAFRSGPLNWRLATWWLGCRNAHPRSLEACTVHGGRTYRISAPLLTCRTGPGYGSQEAILSLVSGVRP